MRCERPDDVLVQLADCVAVPSPTPPGDAALVADWVADWAAELGATVSRQEVWPGAENVLATLRFGAGPRLVFNSHMDVVDPSAQTWTTPAYQPVTADGRMTGRGTCDAKGSLVAMLAALERLAAAPAGLVGELVLTAVVAEEAGGLGSLRLVRDGLFADAAVVGEPTGLRIARAHKGTYMHTLRFTGTAAHSAAPWLGRNAVADAAAFVAATERETARLKEKPHPALGPATMTVTLIEGGTFQNTVPGSAMLTVDRRLVPGETHADCDRQLADLLDRLAAQRPGLVVEPPETIVATVPSETAESELIVRSALAAVGRVGRPLERAVGFNAGCDMSKLVGAGVPTVICGPGDLAQAHGPDEYVDVREVVDAVSVYEFIARDVLSGREGSIR
ncbi:MAG TPA: ArgE/DapE family deacylase [Pseudonocardiaceae bacterium]|jgi:acetylornithine deacetylase/succinyl-diaminopimelate desuccinylase family protein|nr:ArgE/DapE family deacylase [Pseudonocardiaceae bacterium]